MLRSLTCLFNILASTIASSSCQKKKRKENLSCKWWSVKYFLKKIILYKIFLVTFMPYYDQVHHELKIIISRMTRITQHIYCSIIMHIFHVYWPTILYMSINHLWVKIPLGKKNLRIIEDSTIWESGTNKKFSFFFVELFNPKTQI